MNGRMVIDFLNYYDLRIENTVKKNKRKLATYLNLPTQPLL